MENKLNAPKHPKIDLPEINHNLPENNPSPPEPFISYAQNFEDIMLWRALKHIKSGCYVDVGANDPVVDSVSKAFYDRGWRGIHIEPTPQYANLLRQARDDETTLEVALSHFDGVLELNYIPGTGISTAIDAHASHFVEKHGFESRRIQVPTLTLKSALQFVKGREVHWLKIDVEGFEEQVLKGWDSETLRPWIMLIEATTPGSEVPAFTHWESILTSADYQFVYFDGLNRFYVASEHDELVSAFSVPPNIFDEAQLSGMASSRWCNVVKVDRENANQVAVRESSLIEQLNSSIEQLNQAASKELNLRHQLVQAASREEYLRQQFEILVKVQRMLEERTTKGPLRLRQLVRHPKAFLRECLGLKSARKVFRAPNLKNGFVDEKNECRLTIFWIMRQPAKAIGILIRQPHKTIRFIVRHPAIFFFGKRFEVVESKEIIRSQKGEKLNISPEASAMRTQLKRSIERTK